MTRTGPDLNVRAQTIHTDRLDLLPLLVEHAEQMAVVLSDPDLHTFIGGTPADAQTLRARYERLVAGSLDPTVSWCNWVIQLRDRADLTGTVQATITTHDNHHIAEIAWVVGTPWQGRGIATEATRGLITWLHHQSVHTVIAHIHPDHHASHAVATAAGLTPTTIHQDGETRWRLAKTP